MNRDAQNDPLTSANPGGEPLGPVTAAEERDALLTSYALDGVHPAGTDAEDLAVADRDRAARLLAGESAVAERHQVDDMRRIAAALLAGRDADLPERSADLRRAVLAAAAGAGAAPAVTTAAVTSAAVDVVAGSPEPRSSRGRLLGAIAGLAAIAAAALLMITLPGREEAALDREVAQLDRHGDRRADNQRDQQAAGQRGSGHEPVEPAADKSLVSPAEPMTARAPEAERSPAKAADAPASGRADANGVEAAKRQSIDEIGSGLAARRTMERNAAPVPANKLAADPGGPGPGPAAAADPAPVAGLRQPAAKPSGAMPADASPGGVPSARDLAAAVPSAPAPIPANRGAEARARSASPLGRTAPASDALAFKSEKGESLAVIDERRGLQERFGRPADRETTEFFATDRDGGRMPAAGGERYAEIVENPFRSPAEAPLSTFSIDVDTASYANVRRFLVGGRLPPRDAVRIEELVNYFRYELPQPAGDAPFSVTIDAAGCPWTAGHRLVRVALQGRSVDTTARPAGNIVFLIDVSGSMRDADKLPLVKQALALLVEELGEDDRVSIVTYAGEAGLVLPPTGGEQKERIRAAIERLSPGGSTHGSAGIDLAYEQAAAGFIAGGVNRVILATDGDLNVGVTSDEALVELIKRKAAGGTFLTVLGVGTGNLQDAKMEKLADNGNGIYAYLDGIREARKVLVEQLTGSTIAIAKDVKIQVEFNPARVASYRLIGYENRVMAAADFRDDRKDAGEIGAGHAVTALYEIVPAGVAAGPGGGLEPLKYQPRQEPAAAVPAADASPELLTVKLRSKRPDGDMSSLQEVPFTDTGAAFDRAPADVRFAAAVASFGMLLRGSRHAGTATLSEVAAIAGGAIGPDAGGYRAEFLDLVRKAQGLGGGQRE